MEIEATFVVIGGGIAGVSCVETLAFLEPEEKIILISESSLIKTVTNLLAITQNMTQFDVEEKEYSALSSKYTNVTVLHDKLLKINAEEKFIITGKSNSIGYKFLCLCTGAKPKLIKQAEDNPYVMGIRDTDSVEHFVSKLSSSRKIIVIGNGGIASELIYKMSCVEIDWIIKDKHISATFVDPGAAEFFKCALENKSPVFEPGPCKRWKYDEEKDYKSGAALGPDWYKYLDIKGVLSYDNTSLNIHYEVEVDDIKTACDGPYPVEVTLTNGKKLSCDLIVSATGVTPSIDYEMSTTPNFSNDGGIIVDEFMKTSVDGIYAAGDVCTAGWPHAFHWFQMKLWTQARQMGCYVAKCMSAHFKSEVIYQDFCFELFTHTTRLFGFKVVLIGLYNAQKLNNEYEILFRMTKGKEYIKFILKDGKLEGAMLIGDTDLEETCENLILNRIDLSDYKEDLLNPNIDIEDYFD